MEAEAGGRRIKAEKFIYLFIMIFKLTNADNSNIYGKIITAGEKLWL